MAEVKEYKAVTAMGTDELNKLIADLIKKGWQPFGGMTITFVSQKGTSQTMISIYCGQAMVK